jgi:hypothetical protein
MGVEALCSSQFVASNAAVQHILPSPLVIDLVFRDAGVARRSAKAARMASRGWNILKSLRHRNRARGPSSSSSNSTSIICRANSSGSPAREEGDDCRGQDNPDYGPRRGIEQQPEKQGQEAETNGRVSVKHGGDRFRRSPSPDFSDEFFTRMMALEASHNACSTSTAAFLDADGSPGLGVESSAMSSEGKEQQLGALGGMGGVQLPSSIKRLRRRNGEGRGESAGCAIRNAFSSMVYMIKVVQSHALQIRQALFSEWDAQEVLLLVHREMHSSFVWLFQQVFACTPKLMVSVMILLANFTVFSMGENVALALAPVTETPPPIALFLSRNPQASLNPSYSTPKQSIASPRLSSSYPSSAGSGGNNNNNPSLSTAESFDGDSWLNGALNQRYMFSQKDSIRDFSGLAASSSLLPEQRRSYQEMLQAWVESSLAEVKSGEALVAHVQLEQETIRRLVAPVVAHLESDDYACFDRTDLEYQRALSKDPFNSLLLANYAQFLYVVRHDNDRYASDVVVQVYVMMVVVVVVVAWVV